MHLPQYLSPVGLSYLLSLDLQPAYTMNSMQHAQHIRVCTKSRSEHRASSLCYTTAQKLYSKGVDSNQLDCALITSAAVVVSACVL
jgi:hypothetical protein